ncbi:MAG: anion permease, partial [Lachnospiraceae bacterium]|nr:anion permease [Lachnospiraceae bacterium]
IMSNVPTCVIFMTIALQFLKLYDKEEERRQTGKAYMLGVTFASMIGGMLTPAGSSINILAIHLLEQSEGISIPFGTWMCIAFPVVIVVLPIAWFLVIKIIGTAPVTVDRKKQFLDELNVGKKIGADEWKVMAILLIMVILWIASSWMPQINVVVVALVGCVVLQIPKVGVITSEEFVKAINVDAIFIVATVLSLGNIIVSAGLGDFINKIELPFAGIWQVLFLVAFMVFGGLVLIPIAPSLITVLIPLIISLGNDRVSPAALVITCALCACNCYFIPLDTVCLITYGQGYYSMSDMPKVSVFLQIWVAFTVSLCVTVFVIMAKI